MNARAQGSPHGDLPEGHPTVNPHGGDGGSGKSGRFRMPKQSEAREDAAVPTGAIQVVVRDGDEAPVGGVEVTLGIVENTIAKGESRQRRAATTDGAGVATFSGLETASSFAYRVSVSRDGATYAAPPFNMPASGLGMQAAVYVYPAVRSVEEATVAMQGILVIELRDEVVQLEQAYRVYNLGGKTWLPGGLPFDMPEGFKAFQGQQGMSDVGFDASGKQVKLRGTISPGLHDAAFKYQLPSPERDELAIDAGILPHVQSFRVIVEAPRGMTLEVDGFPPAEAVTTGSGQRVLVTERETARPEAGFRQVKIRLGGLPTKPQGRWVALGLALAALGAAGWVVARSKGDEGGSQADVEAAKAKLLEELEALEKAKGTGEVGPRTYERARRTLVDALARLLAREGKVG